MTVKTNQVEDIKLLCQRNTTFDIKSLDEGTRQAAILAQLDDENGEDEIVFPVAISSDVPIKRGSLTEILDHSAGAVNLDWAKSGNAPMYLWDHAASERIGAEGYGGTFRNARITTNNGVKQVVVDAVFYRRDPISMDAARKIAIGMLRNVSVGYSIYGDRDEAIEYGYSPEGMLDTIIWRKWKINEFTWLADPADKQGSGIGRGNDGELETDNFITITGERLMKKDKVTKTEVAEDAERAAEATENAVSEEVKDDAEVSGSRSAKASAPKAEAAPAVEAEVEAVDEGARAATAEAKGIDYASMEALMKESGVEDGKRSAVWEDILGNKRSAAEATQSVLNALSEAKSVDTKNGDQRKVNVIQDRGDANSATRKLVEAVTGRGGHFALSLDEMANDAMFVNECRRQLGGSRASVNTITVGNQTGVNDDNPSDLIIRALFQRSVYIDGMTRYPRTLRRDEVIPVQQGQFSSNVIAKDGTRTATNVPAVDGKRTLEMNMHQIFFDYSKDLNRQAPEVVQLIISQLGERFSALLEKHHIEGTGGLSGLIDLAAAADDIPADSATAYGSGNTGAAPSEDLLVRIVEAIGSDNMDQVPGEEMLLTTREILFKLINIWGAGAGATNPVATYRLAQREAGGYMFPTTGTRIMYSNNVQKTFGGNKAIVNNGTLHAIYGFKPANFLLGLFGDTEFTVDPYTQLAAGKVRIVTEQGVDIAAQYEDGVVGSLNVKNSTS